MRILISLFLFLATTPAAASCSIGDKSKAYDLGHAMAIRGIDTTPAAEVSADLTTCFYIGYREGRLQRLIRTSQPHPPRTTFIRPRNG